MDKGRTPVSCLGKSESLMIEWGIGFEPMNDGFADRPLKPLGHPHIVGSLTGFEPVTTRATIWCSTYWATNSIYLAEAEGLEPPTFGFGGRHSTNWTMLPSLRWRDSNPRSRMAADLQSALVAAGEHLIIFLWNLVESNHVLRIFSPAHTPSLPKFHQRRLRDSNPWDVWPPSSFQD